MKISYPTICPSCGFDFMAMGHAEGEFPPATCPQCEKQKHFIDRLSISIVADRLIPRSRNEIDAGDYTLAIICSAMAVECALTQVFFKWKRMGRTSPSSWLTTEQEQEKWEKEYKKGTGRGGFENAANFVSEFLCGKKLDDFTADFWKNRSVSVLIANGFPSNEGQSKATCIHGELFIRRNKIMHWGKVNYEREDASLALNAGCTAVNILKAMDKEKAEAMERNWREAQNEAAISANQRPASNYK